uniref:VCBS repeat-containing protein n=1 Tax=candidate division WOR-3 bacterium TaxID=2052148 RepID=A0A7C3UW38_UNCW3
MRKRLISFFFFISLGFGIIPLPSSPSWQSSDNDYSTGGGFGDIDTNGFIDYVTSNGNDMASNRNAIYFNRNGIIETNASWRSQDQGYFGHLYLGDVNNDRLLDLAVVYLGYGSNQGQARIYRNRGGGLETTPFWQSADQYNSFDCCFGDIDLDGDLDLAVAAGDAYNNIRSPARIYRNNRGTLETTPFWTSLDSQPSDALRFLDINNDGFLDLVVGHRRKVGIYINENGNLPRQPTVSFRVKGWVLRIAIGDYDQDGWVDLAIASNGQLSGDSSQILLFKNRSGAIDTIPVSKMLRNSRYSSSVAFGDANGDGFLELAAGGWWEPISVFENRNGLLDTIPTWSYSMGNNLVCEMIMWGCVRNDHLSSITEEMTGDGARKLFRLRQIPVQFLTRVMINEQILPDSLFAFDPLSGYLSLAQPPGNGETLKVSYRFSPYCDLAVTNWVQSAGNLLFLNTTPPVGILAEKRTGKDLTATITTSSFSLPASQKSPIRIYDASGRSLQTIKELKPGIYFINGKKFIKL